MSDFITNEIYTDGINDVIVRCASFIIAHPGNALIADIEAVRITLAAAHRQSRIYTDQRHRCEWDRVVKQANDLLTRAAEMENYMDR